MSAAPMTMSAPALPPDAYLSFPARSSLVAHADSIAWVETVRGVSNVWRSDGTGATPQKLTAFHDDGMELTSLRLLGALGKSATHACFVRAPVADTNALSLVKGTPHSVTMVLDLKHGSGSATTFNETYSGPGSDGE